MKFIREPRHTFVQAACVDDGHIVELPGGELGLKFSQPSLGTVIFWESGGSTADRTVHVLDRGEAVISIEGLE